MAGLIHRISHVCIKATDLERAERFYVDLLGLVVTEKEPDAIYLRGVEEGQHHSLVIKRGNSPRACYVGYRVREPKDLDRIAELLKRLGLKYRKYEEKGVKDAIAFIDPGGVPVVVYYDMEYVGDLRLKYHLHKGVAPARLAHVNITVKDLEPSYKFYVDYLGFKETEYFLDENNQKFVVWLTMKGDSHELAINKAPSGPALHHFTYYVHDVRDVIKAADIMASAGLWDSIERGPGRHGATQGFYLYLRDPDGIRMELFTGDYLVLDPDKWRPIGWTHEQARYRADFWGRPTPESWRQSTPFEISEWL
ncbi:3,4-dihydroxyphenylacetate 2,3-dioxygenase [Pyrobaculum aerophilum]|uniref:3,4-dihydroxyphenylacetate 2,3-dioxygenase n=1 Tax=Pyrobaculum aerophilum TaxID=13773 RepID=A0A371R778_9CREN|nr:3,4-dihydroxyphenylacetate 2,3-dioxygenase [Pyrobaculum aerophilum]RFA96225.1 3,4-dihydroxyphenylacetate 2,3-dioxygenase [Pyrobaculum aerophilum]RFB00395.1 3,4-dihydroxyphenylacetate 2,3-dioxygenase [Pyrobaculum aerophilum]